MFTLRFYCFKVVAIKPVPVIKRLTRIAFERKISCRTWDFWLHCPDERRKKYLIRLNLVQWHIHWYRFYLKHETFYRLFRGCCTYFRRQWNDTQIILHFGRFDKPPAISFRMLFPVLWQPYRFLKHQWHKRLNFLKILVRLGYIYCLIG